MSSNDYDMQREYVKKPLPLITPRTEFQLSPRPPLPRVTARTEFTEEVVAASATALTPAPSQTAGQVALDAPEDEEEIMPTVRNESSQQSANRVGFNGEKIPKPNGEPGKPNSGGFSISKVLVDTYGWTNEEVTALTEAVKGEVRKKLDTTVSYRSQNVECIDKICEKMTTQSGDWPQLDSYEGCWPVISMIKLALKAQSESSRKSERRVRVLRLSEEA